VRILNKNIPLKIAIADYPHTLANCDGSIPIEGLDAEIVSVKPQIPDRS
jgi:4,5-dihydroxyphthalate decarboxylase